MKFLAVALFCAIGAVSIRALPFEIGKPEFSLCMKGKNNAIKLVNFSLSTTRQLITKNCWWGRCRRRSSPISSFSAKKWRTFLWGFDFVIQMGPDCSSLYHWVSIFYWFQKKRKKCDYFTNIICISQAAENLRILVGTNDLREGGTYYNVEKLIRHQNYNSPSFANDIALIKIVGEIDFNDKVQPIEVASEDVPDKTPLQLSKFSNCVQYSLWIN